MFQLNRVTDAEVEHVGLTSSSTYLYFYEGILTYSILIPFGGSQGKGRSKNFPSPIFFQQLIDWFLDLLQSELLMLPHLITSAAAVFSF